MDARIYSCIHIFMFPFAALTTNYERGMIMGDNMNKATSDRMSGKKVLIIGAIVGVLLIVACAVGFWIYSEGQKEKFEAYHKELSGYGLHSSLSAPGDTVTICFDGEKSNHDNFKGTLTIKKGGDVLVEYRNCRIEKHDDGIYYVKEHLDWTPDLGYPKPNDTVFSMKAHGNWDKIVLIPVMDDEAEYAAFVAPATNHDAAVVLFEELF